MVSAPVAAHRRPVDQINDVLREWRQRAAPCVPGENYREENLLAGVVPFAKAKLLRKVKAGTSPQVIKFSAGVTVRAANISCQSVRGAFTF